MHVCLGAGASRPPRGAPGNASAGAGAEQKLPANAAEVADLMLAMLWVACSTTHRLIKHKLCLPGQTLRGGHAILLAFATSTRLTASHSRAIALPSTPGDRSPTIRCHKPLHSSLKRVSAMHGLVHAVLVCEMQGEWQQVFSKLTETHAGGYRHG
jgi:hypothetical protein